MLATSRALVLIATALLWYPGVSGAQSTGIMSTVAGNGTARFGGDGGLATSASLNGPARVAVDASGNIYIADSGNHRIRKVTAATGRITTVAGNGTAGFGGDGATATSANLNSPQGVALDSAGNLYIADYYNQRIRKVTAATGVINTVAGSGIYGFSGDGGPATEASMRYPRDVAVDGNGNIYIADSTNQRVRKVTAATGTITTVAGNGTQADSGDGGLAISAGILTPSCVAVDGNGNVYICSAAHRIRKVTAGTNRISSVAGNGSAGFAGDGGAATSAHLYFPEGVDVDGQGNLYIADRLNNRIRKVRSATGTISTVAGNGVATFGGDGGNALSASLNGPIGVALDGAGNFVIADPANHRVRKVTYDTTPPTITPNLAGAIGSGGWYVGDVSLSWAVADPESPVSDTTGCGASSVTTDTAGITLTCSATSEGGTAERAVLVRRDATAPVASASGAPLPNAAGWNSGVVTVKFSGTDATSGVAVCSPDLPLVTEGANQTSGSGTCTDNAGNLSAPVSASGINIDSTPPAVSASRAPLPNAAGWNNSPVTASFAAMDALSGVRVDDCDGPTTLSDSGAGQSITGTCADRAGNIASATVSDINIDTTPPVAIASLDPLANAAGWNRQPVVVSFNGTESLSGSGIATCSPPVTVSVDGVGQIVAGACSDIAGNPSNAASAAVNLDRVPPGATINVPAPGATYGQGSNVLAAFSCSDNLSGVSACNGTVSAGSPIDTSSAGGKVFAVTVLDVAGNENTVQVNYTVRANAAPVAPGTIAAQSSTEGQSYGYAVPAFTDPNGDTLSYSFTGLPGWLTVYNPGSNPRYLQGTPPYSESGSNSNRTYWITVTATDPGGLRASKTFSLTVQNANGPPARPDSIPSQTAREGEYYGYSVPIFPDPDGDPVSYSFTGLPSWLTVYNPATNPRYLYGRPPATESGPNVNKVYWITVTASDPSGSTASRAFSLTVQNVNNPPVAPVIPDASFIEGQNLSYTGPRFFDPDYDTLTYTYTGLPSWLTVYNPSSNPRYLYGQAPAGTAGQSWVVTLTATDPMGGSASQNFTVRVQAP